MEEFKKIKDMLDRGEVFAYPTETVYGLGADPFNREAVEKIMNLKGRPLYQTPIMLVPNKDWIAKLTKNVSPLAIKLMDEFWPGALTIVFEASKEVPAWVIRDDETIALRQSSSPWVMSFLDYYQKPIISTSANLSGEQSALSIEDVKRTFPVGVEHYVDGGSLSPSQGSTIVSLKNSTIHLLRKGAITQQDLEVFTHG